MIPPVPDLVFFLFSVYNRTILAILKERRFPMKNPVQQAVPLLIEWYAASRRKLPWREDPTPYHTWIAEIMLQQTRIEAVLPYYERFLKALPDVPALAAVPEDRLLKLWEGLGYYSRARNLKKAAQILTAQYNGKLPASAEELKKLPGIGDYTAGSIASIAFSLPEPAVDGNVLRVMTRLLACPDDIDTPATRKRLASLLRAEYPAGRDAGLLTEGIMELGETVCLPNAVPRCDHCPIRRLCEAHRCGAELSYPVRSGKKPRRVEQKTVRLLCHDGRYAIRKRPSGGLLAGLWEFPNEDGFHPPENGEFCGEARHIFTHVEWQMRAYRVACSEESPDYLWKSPEEIARDYPLPTAFRKFQRWL